MNLPAYIYDESRICGNIQKLRNTFPQFTILYSIKANPYPPLVRYIASQNIGADAASKNEVLLACKEGFTPDQIYYSGPGKTKTDLVETVGRKFTLYTVTGTSGASTVGTSALNHKTAYYTVKTQSVVKSALYKRYKVVDRVGRYIGIKFGDYLFAVLHCKRDLGIAHRNSP